MGLKPPVSLRLRTPAPRPFPTRGVPGGWRDAWDADPLAGVPVVRSPRDAQGRSVCDADLRVELVARARDDGRWVASVVAQELPSPVPGQTDRSPAASAAAWPSVNGPTAAAALDALEAELRHAARGAQPDIDGETALPRREGR